MTQLREVPIELINGYNKILTENKEQTEFLLLIVNDYKRRFPNVKKRDNFAGLGLALTKLDIA